MPLPVSGGAPLERDAERLLAALADGEADGRVDPTDETLLLVSRMRGGVPLGAGRFGRSAGDALVRSDLAVWEGARLRATGAGRARHRRRTAPADTAFLDQHRETGLATVLTDDGPTRVRVDHEESPLAWLRRRRDRDGEPLIDAACFEAGERLRADIAAAALLPGVTARWDAPMGGGPGGPSEATDRLVAARQRLAGAVAAVGADFGNLLIDLCGFLKGLETIERERGWPARSAKVVVRLALGRLAEHYGLQREARGPASKGIRAWHAVVIEGGKS